MDWKFDSDLWWWALMLSAGGLLLWLVLRNRRHMRWIGYGLMNLLIAAVALYLINTLHILGDLVIPLNLLNIAVIGVLGVPGLLLVAALHGWVL
jgi:inhibitor of the pro-sigma K processing machinery